MAKEWATLALWGCVLVALTTGAAVPEAPVPTVAVAETCNNFPTADDCDCICADDSASQDAMDYGIHLQMAEGIGPQEDDESSPTSFTKELGDDSAPAAVSAGPAKAPAAPASSPEPPKEKEDDEAAPSRYSQELGDLPDANRIKPDAVEGVRVGSTKKSTCLCNKKKKNMGAGCRKENWRKRAKKCARPEEEEDVESEIEKRKQHLKDLEAQLDAEKRAALAAERARKLEEARKAAEKAAAAVVPKPTPTPVPPPPEVIKCDNYDPMEGFRPKGVAIPETVPITKSEFVSRILNAQNQRCGQSTDTDIAAEAPKVPFPPAEQQAMNETISPVKPPETTPIPIQEIQPFPMGGVKEKPDGHGNSPDYAGIGPRELAAGFPRGEVISLPLPGATEVVPDRQPAEQAARVRAEAIQAREADLAPDAIPPPTINMPAGGSDDLPLDPEPPIPDGLPGAAPSGPASRKSSVQVLAQLDAQTQALVQLGAQVHPPAAELGVQELLQAQAAGNGTEVTSSKCLSRTCKRENDLNAEPVVLAPMECYDECQLRNCEKKFVQGWEKWYMCVQSCIGNCYTIAGGQQQQQDQQSGKKR